MTENPHRTPMGRTLRILHLLLILVLLLSWPTGEMADDYRHASHGGYDLHAAIGLFGGLVLGARLLWGVVGRREMRFVRWLPVTSQRWKLIYEDLLGLARLHLPRRDSHEGLAGLVELLALLSYAAVFGTGFAFYLGQEPGRHAYGAMRLVKEAHELSLGLLITVVTLHVIAVWLHGVNGRQLWMRMFFLAKEE